MTVACFKFSNPVRSQRQKLSKRPIRQQRRCSKILFSVSCHRYCVKIDVVFLLHCATQEFVSMPLKIFSYPRYQNFYKTVCFLVKTFLTKKHLLFLKRNLNLISSLKFRQDSVLRSQRLYKNSQVNKGLLQKNPNRFGKFSLIDGQRIRLSGKPLYLGTLFFLSLPTLK